MERGDALGCNADPTDYRIGVAENPVEQNADGVDQVVKVRLHVVVRLAPAKKESVVVEDLVQVVGECNTGLTAALSGDAGRGGGEQHDDQNDCGCESVAQGHGGRFRMKQAVKAEGEGVDAGGRMAPSLRDGRAMQVSVWYVSEICGMDVSTCRLD